MFQIWFWYSHRWNLYFAILGQSTAVFSQGDDAKCTQYLFIFCYLLATAFFWVAFSLVSWLGVPIFGGGTQHLHTLHKEKQRHSQALENGWNLNFQNLAKIDLPAASFCPYQRLYSDKGLQTRTKSTMHQPRAKPQNETFPKEGAVNVTRDQMKKKVPQEFEPALFKSIQFSFIRI